MVDQTQAEEKQRPIDKVAGELTELLVGSIPGRRGKKITKHDLTEFVDYLTNGKGIEKAKELGLEYDVYSKRYLFYAINNNIEFRSSDRKDILNMAFGFLKGYDILPNITSRRQMYYDTDETVNASSKSAKESNFPKAEVRAADGLCSFLARKYLDRGEYYPDGISADEPQLVDRRVNKNELIKGNSSTETKPPKPTSEPPAVSKTALSILDDLSENERATAAKLGLTANPEDPLLIDIYKKVITEEAAHSGTFSPRTLSALKLLDRDEIACFLYAVDFVFRCFRVYEDEDDIIFLPPSWFRHIPLLKECNLIGDRMVGEVVYGNRNDWCFPIAWDSNGFCLVIYPKDKNFIETGKYTYYKLTRIGAELYSATEKRNSELSLVSYGSELKMDGLDARVYKIISLDEKNGYDCSLDKSHDLIEEYINKQTKYEDDLVLNEVGMTYAELKDAVKRALDTPTP